ncbi:MAG: hypothetical protein ACJ782_07830, partial [Actinomycetota bacterium]
GQHTAKVDDRNWEHVDLLSTLAAALKGAGCRRTRRCARSSAPSPGGAWSGSAPGPTWSAGPSTASR